MDPTSSKKSDRDSKRKKSHKEHKHKKHHKRHEKKRTRREKDERHEYSGSSNSESESESVEVPQEAMWVEKHVELLPEVKAFSSSVSRESLIDKPEQRTVFTDFRNPLSFASFKKPQDYDNEERSNVQASETSKKRPRSNYSSEGTTKPETTSKPAFTIAPISTNSVLSEDELNKLQAKALRASMLGLPDADSLEEEFQREKKKFDNRNSSKTEILPMIDSRGRIYDTDNVTNAETSKQSLSSRRKKEKYETHDERGQRIRYNKDDDELTLEDLVRQERLGFRESMDSQVASRIIKDSKFEDDLEYMDEQADKIAKTTDKTAQQKREFVIRDYKKSKQIIEGCAYCLKENSLPQAPMVSLGVKTYLALPSVKEMCEGHCLIVPVEHCLTTLDCDDDVWDEIRNFMKCLIQMFADENRGVIFMETVINLKWQKHTFIECIPMPIELLDDAPAYFKEAILSSEGDWSQNKKLINTTKERGFRQSMVKELPYFHVWFGLDKGFGHVIENGKKFPTWFGKEIVAGICDLPPDVWRRPKKLNHRDNHQRVQDFIKKWKKWDWTKILEGDPGSQEPQPQSLNSTLSSTNIVPPKGSSPQHSSSLPFLPRLSRPSGIKRTASYSSFLGARNTTSSSTSTSERNSSFHGAFNFFQSDESPTTLTKTPTYEYYGFVLYLASFIAFVIYLLWAYLPDEALISLGITYYPSRYWALALPVWTFVLILFIYIAFVSINFLNTAPLDSFNTVTDDHANVGQNLSQLSGITDDFVPELHDIPIGIVNACLYQNLRGLSNKSEEEREAEEEDYLGDIFNIE
ncbi:5980_t:CDS:10 [Ambispora leptoticha]|uniref:5980_t:CDS:1 n=1 Tax=Ambispora leptoticha TaxID=144679 RepID=A0A9N9GAZ0_9GLOM|nr:5980_t:CDS:10 [Ambispora leptoticha]